MGSFSDPSQSSNSTTSRQCNSPAGASGFLSCCLGGRAFARAFGFVVDRAKRLRAGEDRKVRVVVAAVVERALLGGAAHEAQHAAVVARLEADLAVRCLRVAP